MSTPTNISPSLPRLAGGRPRSGFAATYVKYELLRTVRNKRSFIFSLIFPIVMYFLLAGPNRNKHNFGGSAAHPTHLFAPQYYMLGLLAFGTMIAAMSAGARIAAERAVGWNRQLRITPLTPRMYFRAKVLTSYLMAAMSIVLLYAAGIAMGVRIHPFGNWFKMTGLVLVALVPFAALGIALGHLLTSDSMGPALGGITSLFAFLGGTWFPITGHGFFVQVCKTLPSYWLTEAGHIGYGGTSDPWGSRGWVTIADWALACVAFARWAYRRDTGRA
jgi:ABC-2 type transport system permease protein